MSTVPVPGANNSFGDESVQGGEIGLKTRLFDRSMTLNLAGYRYDYTGLQVGSSLAPEGGIPVIRTVNAGAAEAHGIEFDTTYRPRAVPNLSLNAAVNWNKTRYTDFKTAPCYSGQTIQMGCNQVLNPATGLFTSQDLTGAALVRAPDWEANFGFDYDIDLADGYRITITSSNKYSSPFFTSSGINRPNDDNIQDEFIKANLGVTLNAPDDRWQLALIGNNLTDEIVSGNCGIFNAANGSVLGGHITGGDRLGVAGHSEVNCWTERGRSVWLRLTYRH
jgi:outer membrane receptor protein involved in Fe transport